MKTNPGPRTAGADAIHAMKYREVGEDFREAMNRVAFALKDDDKHYHELREILLDMRFLPGGRVQNAMGASRETTPYNCFVSGTIADSFVDGRGCIMERAHEAAATMRMGGGIGYDFSTLRPNGALIARLQSHSSGPVSFMRIFNEICLATASSGHRRGAQMGVLRIDHPDVEEFIRSKHNNDQFTGFNISLAVTDEFMEAMLAGKPFDLRFNGTKYRTVDAVELWEKVMRSTFDWAEPGVIFIDAMNRMNNLYYCETIAATNPCSEQPLPPFGACLLGSFNLTKYLRPNIPLTVDDAKRVAQECGSAYYFDYDQLKADVPIIVRAMDNVVDRARYPLAQQRGEAHGKRRMGLGVTGVANTIEAIGEPYGTKNFIGQLKTILRTINEECYRASAMLSKEKGSFPLYDTDKYLQGKFVQTLSDETRDLIGINGIRNSHLTSIAPTGTISLAADNVSSGIEPVFDYSTKFEVNTPTGKKEHVVEDYGVGQLGIRGRTMKDLSPLEHVEVLIATQGYVDSAVSKTCNVPENTDWDDFKNVYRRAWEGGAKGCATFTVGGKRGAWMQEGSSGSCAIDAETGRRDCA